MKSKEVNMKHEDSMKTTKDLLIADFKAGFEHVAHRKPLMGDDHILLILADGRPTSGYHHGVYFAWKMLYEGWKF